MSAEPLKDLGSRFIHFAQELFRELGETIDTSGALDRGYDFSFSTGTTKTVVQVKIYRSQRTASAVLRNAVIATAFAKLQERAQDAILVTNLAVERPSREALENTYAIKVFDYNVLSGLVEANPKLRAQFDEIVREAYAFHRGPLPQSEPLSEERVTEAQVLERPQQSTRPPTRGSEISQRLKSIASGKDQAAEFEAACIEALKYAFSEDFVGWKDQHSTDTAMHRFDLVARISSREEFWQSLIHDFRTRYVVFEFKNYENPITQTQIYTTEKYLYPAAMRSTAIIISRQGANENALSACRGALRESRKLILTVSMEQLCSMVISKDNGTSPSDLLATQLDEMLFSIER